MVLHPQSRLLIAGVPASPAPSGTPGNGLRCIAPDDPAGVRLALSQGASFCVTRATIVEDEAPGHIHTLTSGSTGSPKRIRRTYDSWTLSAAVNRDLWQVTTDDHSVILGGLEQSLALYALVEGLVLGLTVNVMSGERPDRQCDALQQATMVYATPTQIRQVFRRTLPKLRLVIIGGGALDEATKALVKTNAPAASVWQFYGAAETSFISLAGPDAPEGSVGRPYPGVALRPLEQPGPIWVKSPYLSVSYAAGGSPSTQRDGDWMTVGEIGHMRDGYLYILGRSDRMFTVADQNLFPETIEAALTGIAGVNHVAVLPGPDAQRGNMPVVIYAGSIAPDDLMMAVRRLSLPMPPRRAVRIDDWPTLPGGKPDLQTLMAMMRSRL